MAEREIRYCTTEDGVRIAYSVEGAGQALVVCPYLVESFALEHLLPRYAAFMHELGVGKQLIRFDARGTGLSARGDIHDFSHEALMRDLAAVVKAAGLRKFSLLGWGISGPRAIDYAASHPRNVEHLMLFGTFARAADAIPETVVRGFAEMARANWTLGARAIADLNALRNQSSEQRDSVVQFADLLQQSADGPVVADIFLQAHASSDVTSRLQNVKCPTLVLHYLNDPFPFAGGQQLASAIKNARLVPFEDDGFVLLDIERVSGVLTEFMSDGTSQHKSSAPADTAPVGVTTILFTDLVGHTEMMRRLGDEQGRAVLREHERITRDLLKQHGGAEVKTMGDGFMASFASVTKAVDCAIALQRAFAAHEGEPLQVRVGLNAGEPIAEDGDLFGSTVILAARIAASAGAGEILVPDTVRGLLSGKGFMFGDRGEFVPKGFDEGVRVWDVHWRD